MHDFVVEAWPGALGVKFGLGQAVRRKEDVRFVTGSGRYLDDVRLDGEVITDGLAAFPHPGVLQVGKRHFVRVV